MGKGQDSQVEEALYCLKQSPKVWFKCFYTAMVVKGYTLCQADQALFVKRKKGKITTLIVYVNDIVITGNDEAEIRGLKHNLARAFEIKDLVQLKYFLGIEVARSQKGIFISQRKYKSDFLNETRMSGINLLILL